jgi:hypothetical protein
MKTATQASAEASAAPADVWWRLPIVWMVIGGPAVVVVASFATLALAIRYPDPVLTESAVSNGQKTSSSELPAVQARNHAATPQPLPER